MFKYALFKDDIALLRIYFVDQQSMAPRPQFENL